MYKLINVSYGELNSTKREIATLHVNMSRSLAKSSHGIYLYTDMGVQAEMKLDFLI